MYKSPNILNTQDALSRKPYDPISPNSTRAETSRDETLPAENGTSRSPQDPAPTSQKRVSYATAAQQPGFGPVYESVDQAVKCAELGTVQLGETMTRDDFTRAVTVATVSALRHQQQQHPRRTSFVEQDGASSGHGGHDAPSWSRTLSASVLLGCTALYAIIAGRFRPFSFRDSLH
jgi:Ca2+:H+ antiporter